MNYRRILIVLFLLAAFGLSTYTACAQNNSAFIKYKEKQMRRLKFGLGWSFMETDKRPFYILDGFGGWSGRWLPKTFNVEKRFGPKIRGNIGISKTRYKPRFVQKTPEDKIISYGARQNYFAIDLNVLYNFRSFKHYMTLRKTRTLNNLYKERFFFDGYFLAGVGFNTIGFGLNTGIGTDFWLNPCWGLQAQSVAKWPGFGADRLHFQHTFGVIYRYDENNKSTALTRLRKIRKKKKDPFDHARKKGIVEEQEGDDFYEDDEEYGDDFESEDDY